MANFYHVLVTIFNVRVYPDSNLQDLQVWTKKRISLFERYCLPAVLKQTAKTFDWLLIIDPSTNKENLSYLNQLSKTYSFIHLEMHNDIDTCEIPINRFIQAKNVQCKYIITSRLDNDDILHKDFMKTVQQLWLNNRQSRIINFVTGYTLKIQDKGRHLLYKTLQFENPFISLIEKNSTQLNTIRKHRHFEWGTVLPIENIHLNRGLWIQVIHDDNLCNTVLGQPIKKPSILQDFQLNNQSATHSSIRKHEFEKLKVFFQRVTNKLNSFIPINSL